MPIPQQSVVYAFQRLESDLVEFVKQVPYVTAHDGVWSPALATIILEASSQLDSLWKLMHSASTNHATIEHYFQVFRQNVVDRWLVVWSDPAREVQPFQAWNGMSTYSPLPWWQAYNKLKHNRWSNIEEATLNHAVNSLGALFLAIVHCPACEQAIVEAEWVHTDFIPVATAIKDLMATPETSQYGGTIESKLFSYMIGCNDPKFAQNISAYVRVSRRFGHYLENKYGRRFVFH